jgi:hypothetical protein
VHVKARAGAVGRLVDALAVESLDVMDLCDASGLDEPGVDAATYLALTLAQVEQRGGQALPWSCTGPLQQPLAAGRTHAGKRR